MKKIYFSVSVFLISFTAGLFIFDQKIQHIFLPERSPLPQMEVSDEEDPMMPKREPKPEVRARDWDTVGVYRNLRHGFYVEYPAGNFIRSPEIHTAPEPGEYFLEKAGLRSISFYTKPTNGIDACQQLLNENSQGWTFEKSISVDGRPATVMHELWKGKESREIKLVCVMKNDTAYFIYSEYVDHERIWNSFRFE